MYLREKQRLRAHRFLRLRLNKGRSWLVFELKIGICLFACRINLLSIDGFCNAGCSEH